MNATTITTPAETLAEYVERTRRPRNTEWETAPDGVESCYDHNGYIRRLWATENGWVAEVENADGDRRTAPAHKDKTTAMIAASTLAEKLRAKFMRELDRELRGEWI